MVNLLLKDDEGPSIVAKIREKINIENLVLAAFIAILITISLAGNNVVLAEEGINIKDNGGNSEVYIECISQKEPKISDIEALTTGKNTIFAYNGQSQLSQCFPNVLIQEKAEDAPTEPQKQYIDIMDPYKVLTITTDGDDVQMSFERKPDECSDNDSEDCKLRKEFEDELNVLVEGHPIEAMVPEIAKRDRIVVAFVIGIGKKESNWGKRVPHKNGQDCYNYWGYRGGDAGNGSAMGYSCFASPEEGANVIADRIERLVNEYGRTTPSEMIVWKCGSTCAGHDPYGVQKWISDVQIYYNKIYSNKLAMK